MSVKGSLTTRCHTKIMLVVGMWEATGLTSYFPVENVNKITNLQMTTPLSVEIPTNRPPIPWILRNCRICKAILTLGLGLRF